MLRSWPGTLIEHHVLHRPTRRSSFVASPPPPLLAPPPHFSHPPHHCSHPPPTTRPWYLALRIGWGSPRHLWWRAPLLRAHLRLPWRLSPPPLMRQLSRRVPQLRASCPSPSAVAPSAAARAPSPALASVTAALLRYPWQRFPQQLAPLTSTRAPVGLLPRLLWPDDTSGTAATAVTAVAARSVATLAFQVEVDAVSVAAAPAVGVGPPSPTSDRLGFAEDTSVKGGQGRRTRAFLPSRCPSVYLQLPSRRSQQPNAPPQSTLSRFVQQLVCGSLPRGGISIAKLSPLPSAGQYSHLVSSSAAARRTAAVVYAFVLVRGCAAAAAASRRELRFTACCKVTRASCATDERRQLH